MDIPSLISLYNEHRFTGGGFIAPMALMSYDEDKRPDSCIGCRSCEAVCPQQIRISEIMADFCLDYLIYSIEKQRVEGDPLLRKGW